MLPLLEIYPDKIKNFANEYRNPIFYVIVTEFLCKEIVLKPSKFYSECKLIICRAHEKISDILKTLRQQDADILFIPHLYSDILFNYRMQALALVINRLTLNKSNPSNVQQ
jgi:hypothetical protein